MTNASKRSTVIITALSITFFAGCASEECDEKITINVGNAISREKCEEATEKHSECHSISSWSPYVDTPYIGDCSCFKYNHCKDPEDEDPWQL